jgi:hypothetical protein
MIEQARIDVTSASDTDKEDIVKHATAILAAVGLLALTPFAATPAFADPAPSTTHGAPAGYCAANIDQFPAETFGNCMAIWSTLNADSPGWLAQICSFFIKSRPDDFYAVYDSYDECIRDRASSL